MLYKLYELLVIFISHISQHNNMGRVKKVGTEEWKKHCKKIGFKKGYIPWNKGKTYEQLYGNKSEEVKQKWRKSRKGFRHTEETKKRLRESKLGNKNPMWKGDKAKEHAGAERARRWFKPKPCEYCGNKAEIHHIDGNKLNNDPKNIRWLCRRCHMIEDKRLEKWIELNKIKKCIIGPRDNRGRFIRWLLL